MRRVASRRAFRTLALVALAASSSCGNLLGVDEFEFRAPVCPDAPRCETKSDSPQTNGAGGINDAGGGPTEEDPGAVGGQGGVSAPVEQAGQAGQLGQAGEAGEVGQAGQVGHAGQAGEGGAASTIECTTHLDCNPDIDNDPVTVSDDPYLCIDSRCVRIRNDKPDAQFGDMGCLHVLGHEQLSTGAEPFVFGAFARVYHGQPMPTPAARNYELAVREFASRGGITIAGKTRMPVAVVCEGISVNHDYLERTFDHLVNTLRVPAVITTFQPDDLKWTFEKVHEEWKKDVLFVSAYQSDSSLLALDDDSLLWHILGSPFDMAPPYVPLVERVEAYVKGTAGISGPIRVALVDSQTSFHADMGDLLHDQLRFNGKSPSENGDDYYLRLRIPGEDKFDEIIDDYLPKLQEFVPDVVVFTGAYEATLMMILMENWDLPPGVPRARPFYVLSPSQYGYRAELREAVQGLDLYDRVAGINYAAAEDDTLYKAYLSAFEATFPNDAYLGGTENFYDAAYFLIYSAVAAGNAQPLDGSRMALGFERLLEGPAYPVGGMHIPAVAKALRSEPSIALQGTMGPPTFDPTTGAWRGNGSVFCIDENAEGDAFLMDVMRYDRDTGELSGDFPCIEGF
jgi:hypothetical protein